MEIVYDIIINVLSDGISFLLGMLFVILYSFLKNSIHIKKLIRNSRNHLEVLMNFELRNRGFEPYSLDIKKIQ